MDSYLIKRSFKKYHCKSGIAIFTWRATRNFIYDFWWSIARVSSTPQTLKKPSFISLERTPNSFHLSSTPTPKPSSSPPKPRFYPYQDSPPVKRNGTPVKFKGKPTIIIKNHPFSEEVPPNWLMIMFTKILI